MYILIINLSVTPFCIKGNFLPPSWPLGKILGSHTVKLHKVEHNLVLLLEALSLFKKIIIILHGNSGKIFLPLVCFFCKAKWSPFCLRICLYLGAANKGYEECGVSTQVGDDIMQTDNCQGDLVHSFSSWATVGGADSKRLWRKLTRR